MKRKIQQFTDSTALVVDVDRVLCALAGGRHGKKKLVGVWLPERVSWKVGARVKVIVRRESSEVKP